MIRTFQVKLNGKEYSAEIEETTQSSAAIAAASMPAPKMNYAPQAPVVQTVPTQAPAVTTTSQPTSGSGVVKSEIPATVFKIMVAKGDSVKAGQVVVVLEAMKMEIETFASIDGTITEINVKEGDSVNAGDTLVTIG